jgi:hypothetical protein
MVDFPLPNQGEDGLLTGALYLDGWRTQKAGNGQSSNLGRMVDDPGGCGADPRVGVFDGCGNRDYTRRAEGGRCTPSPRPRRGGCQLLSFGTQAVGAFAE